MNKLKLLRDRSKYRKLIREFFHEKGFLEVQTPLLVKNPGLEPNIHYFETEFRPLMGKGERAEFYLPTSPEYHLKKALSFGAENIFEITRAFRNGEWGKEHRPEFEMIEWYRQPGNYEDISHDVEELLVFLWKEFEPTRPLSFRHEQLRDVFLQKANIDLEEVQKATLSHFRQKLLNIGVESTEVDSFEDLFHRVFIERIEPSFSKDEILFLWDFPAPLRALSKLSDNKYFCKRFEVYWGSIELGNAFDELVNAEELREVCERDQKKRVGIYGKSPPLDEEFLSAHEKLQGEIGGIAMGMDRIFQFLMQANALDDVMLF